MYKYKLRLHIHVDIYIYMYIYLNIYTSLPIPKLTMLKKCSARNM